MSNDVHHHNRKAMIQYSGILSVSGILRIHAFWICKFHMLVCNGVYNIWELSARSYIIYCMILFLSLDGVSPGERAR